MNKFKHIILFSILSILLLNFTNAISSDGSTSIITSYNQTARGISIVDNTHIYLLCIQNECDNIYGENTTVLKYNSVTNNINRSDILNGGGYITMMKYNNGTLNNDFAKSRYSNLQMFGNGYYIYTNMTGTTENILLYTYDQSTSEWTLRDTDSVAYGGGSGILSGTSTPLTSFNALSSTQYPNDTTFSIHIAYDYVPYSILGNYNIYYQSLPDVSNNGNILQRINGEADGIVYFSNVIGITNVNNNIYSNGSNFSTIGIGAYGDIVEGIVDKTANYYYVTNGLYVFLGNVSTGIDSNSSSPTYPVDLINYANCSNYFGIMNITDMSCINRNNCLFIGYRINNNNSMAIGFDGNSCTSYQGQMSQEFNITQKKLYDIALLDNTYYITGDNVLFTIGQATSLGTQCLNNVTYCDNLINSTGGLVCSVGQTHHCGGSLGCYQNNSVSTCDNTGGNNTCNIIGLKTCTSTTSYSTCADFDSNGFYDLDTITICSAGYYCNGNTLYNATCTAVTSSGLSSNGAINVIPYSISSNDTAYSLDSNSRTLSVTTSNFIHNQRFYTSGSNSYIARDCQYNEVNIYTSTAVNTIFNVSNTPFTQTISSNSRVTLNLLPSDLKYVNITVKDQLGVSMGSYNIIRDISNKSVTISYPNGTIVYTDYSTNTFDDLTNLNITFIYDFQSSTYTTSFIFDRQNDNHVSTQAQSYTGSSIASILINTSNTTINSLLEGEIFSTNIGFQALLSNDITFEPCLYTQSGTYQVRTYNYVLGAPDYSNFVDYIINIKQLGASPSDVSNINNITSLTTTQKTIYAFLIILGFILLIGILLFVASKNSESGGAIVGIGVLSAIILGVVIDILLDLINVGWALLIIIPVVALIVFMFKIVFIRA